MTRPTIKRDAEFAWTDSAEIITVKRVYVNSDEEVMVVVSDEHDDLIIMTLDEIYGYFDQGKLAMPPKFEPGEIVSNDRTAIRINYADKVTDGGIWAYHATELHHINEGGLKTGMYGEPAIEDVALS